jgi:hypothetical protein
MTNQEKLDEILLIIRDTNLYLLELTHKGDIQGLNLYRIFLNEKIMEAVKLQRRIKDGLEG